MLRKQQIAEEEARIKQLQEEEERKYQEQLAKEEAERKAIADEKDRKAKAKLAKVEAQKAAGTYLTKSEKEKQKKLQMKLEQMKAAGLVPVVNSSSSTTSGNVLPSELYKKKTDKKANEVKSNELNSEQIEETQVSPTDDIQVVATESVDDIEDDWEAAAEKIDLKVVQLAEQLSATNVAALEESSDEEEAEEEDMLAAERRRETEILKHLGEQRAIREEEARKKRELEALERMEMELKEREAAARREEAHRQRKLRYQNAFASRVPTVLRAPISAIMGHVDTGKTKLLDKIRHTSVQEGEAGGITQQIGATQFPRETLIAQTSSLQSNPSTAFDIRVPGLLIIDTPGHEAFSNLRHRGSSLCDVAILVIDLMHGLEPQTIESINILRSKKCPFVVALNKVDRCYGWKTQNTGETGKDIRPIQEALALQDENCQREFYDRTQGVITQLMEQGLNAALYWKNDDVEETISLVPTSALCGDGIPDLLRMLIVYSQEYQIEKLMFMKDYVQSTVLEVKVLDGLGHTVDVILVHGELKIGDTIVVSTMEGPLVTTIKGLLTPPPNREMR